MCVGGGGGRQTVGQANRQAGRRADRQTEKRASERASERERERQRQTEREREREREKERDTCRSSIDANCNAIPAPDNICNIRIYTMYACVEFMLQVCDTLCKISVN